MQKKSKNLQEILWNFLTFLKGPGRLIMIKQGESGVICFQQILLFRTGIGLSFCDTKGHLFRRCFQAKQREEKEDT